MKLNMDFKKDPKDVLREEVLAHPRLLQFFKAAFKTEVELNERTTLKEFLTDYLIEQAELQFVVDELDLQHSRCCSECGKPMYEGYCIENGLEYYCSDECLHKNLSEEEYNALHDEGNADSYWTSWLD